MKLINEFKGVVSFSMRCKQVIKWKTLFKLQKLRNNYENPAISDKKTYFQMMVLEFFVIITND